MIRGPDVRRDLWLVMDWPLIGQTSDNTSETLIGAIMRIVRIVTGPPIADFLKEIILKQEDAGDIQFYTNHKL